MTQVFTAKVIGGVIVAADVVLPEGAEVTVSIVDPVEVGVTSEQEMILRESIAQADRGERIASADVLRELRRR